MVPYREAIGSLMYAALGMWPDITFSVSFLLQFMQNPGRPHWEVVKRVFRYLRGTRDYSLVIGSSGCLEWTGGSQDGLQGFCDADWASQEHRHSTSGYVFTIDGGAMSWSSKKQGIVALSTTEAEYVSLTHAAKETLWLRAFLAEIARPLRHPTTLFCDNQSAITVMKNNQYHARTKHIDIRHHFIRDHTTRGAISIEYCPMAENTADILTKPLAAPRVERLALTMGLRSAGVLTHAY